MRILFDLNALQSEILTVTICLRLFLHNSYDCKSPKPATIEHLCITDWKYRLLTELQFRNTFLTKFDRIFLQSDKAEEVK